MDKWYRDAFCSMVIDDLNRFERDINALDQVRAHVARKMIAILSDARPNAACKRNIPTADHAKRIEGLMRSLEDARDNTERRRRILMPSDRQTAWCDASTCILLRELTKRYERIVDTEIPKCVNILRSAAKSFIEQR